MFVSKRSRAGFVIAIVVVAAVLYWFTAPGAPVRLAAVSGGGSENAHPESTASRPTDTQPVEWSRPRTAERRKDRQDMVEYQIRRRGDWSDSVLAAMRNVPRHWFVPGSEQGAAYADRPVPIGHGQTISQPYIVALMTEVLALGAGDKVLEVGTGSGYQAAVLNELTPNVFSVEIIEPLADRAAETFKARGYDAIRTKHADGYFGWPEHAPFDAIIVTCAASHVPPPLIQQLKPGGRMCIPVGGPFWNQRLLLITKEPDGTTRSKNLLPVSFVPMTGEIERK
jgi:protein-L-isoaspartate(D-aspartate) O-methyltransferase